MLNAIYYLYDMLEQLRIDQLAPVSMLQNIVLLYLAIFFAVYVGFFAIKAVAVCLMAKKHGIKNWWLGMIPFANFIVIGKLAGPVRVFNFDIKNVGWIVAIVGGVLKIASMVIGLICYGEYFVTLFGCSLPENAYDISPSYIVTIVVSVYSYAEYFLDIFYILAYAMLVYAFFSKYSPEKRWLFALLSVFIEPIFGIFVLAVRNNRAYSSLNEYYNEKYARRFGQTYNPYSDPFRTRENPYEDKKAESSSDPFDTDDDNSSPFEGF